MYNFYKDAATAINELEASLAITGQLQNVVKTGTESMALIIDSISELLDNSDDLLIPEFSDSQPEMLIEYENNRFIGLPVTQHTTLSVNVFSDAAKTQAIENANISLSKPKRSAVTDFKGNAVIEKFRGGELSAVISANGFTDSLIHFIIKNGEDFDMDVVLSAGGIIPSK